MSSNWKDLGSAEGFISSFIPGVEYRAVENMETGEIRRIYKSSSQTVGEAIAEGQFLEEDDI